MQTCAMKTISSMTMKLPKSIATWLEMGKQTWLNIKCLFVRATIITSEYINFVK